MNKQLVDIKLRNKTVLKGMILSNPNFSEKQPAILTIHGWTSEMARYPERMAPMVDMGYLVVLFDLRGHGTTGGDLDTFAPKDHLDDCLAAYDFMISLENVDTDNISVFGSSYGGYLASLLSTKREINQMVLCVPASYPDEIFNKPKLQRSSKSDEYRKKVLEPNADMQLQAIHAFKGDLLLIEAEHDEQVNPQVMKNIRNAAPKSYDYELIKGADHAMRNPGANEARVKVMAKWFEKFI